MEAIKWHKGEDAVHDKVHIPKSDADRMNKYISPVMPMQHQIFFSNLPYFVLGTLDNEGRPWATILTGKPGFIKALSENQLLVETTAPIQEPLVGNLKNRHSLNLVAGLGIDFSNRRRNKVAGYITHVEIKDDGPTNTHVSFGITTNQSIGNCPKYINIRNISHTPRVPSLLHNKWHCEKETPLPNQCIDHIRSCDTIFVATRHLDVVSGSDMGVNHRGGNPGFCRVGKDGNSIVWPDYSGNRMFQSLGNIESDGLCGIFFPDFSTGNVLYVTGAAQNFFEEDAKKFMPRADRVTRVQVTGYVYIAEGLSLSETGVQFSPYNPPVRYLAFEEPTDSSTQIRAKLTNVVPHSSLISTFTFTVETPIVYGPGQYVILDFGGTVKRAYRHMADDSPLSLNDDYVRTWTITSFPPLNPDTGELQKTLSFSITVKRKEGGSISSLLHSKNALSLEPTFRGTSGDFSCFSGNPPKITKKKILFIAAGVGITPFLSMWQGISLVRKGVASNNGGADIDVAVLFTGRGDDHRVLSHLPQDLLYLRIFQTGKPNLEPGILNRRMGESDIIAVPSVLERAVYLCGPEPFMAATIQVLLRIGIKPENLFKESYNF